MNEEDKKIIKNFNFYLKFVDFELIESKQQEIKSKIFQIQKVNKYKDNEDIEEKSQINEINNNNKLTVDKVSELFISDNPKKKIANPNDLCNNESEYSLTYQSSSLKKMDDDGIHFIHFLEQLANVIKINKNIINIIEAKCDEERIEGELRNLNLKKR